MCACKSMHVHLWECLFVSIQSDLYLKTFILFNASSVESCSRWEHTHFIVHANMILFEKNGGSGRSPVKPWSVSKKELSHFLWGGKPARMAQWLQGWNNKQGQLDYCLWSKVTYCIWNMYCSVNSFFQSLMFHYKNKLSIVLRGSARMLFWETTPCSSK